MLGKRKVHGGLGTFDKEREFDVPTHAHDLSRRTAGGQPQSLADGILAGPMPLGRRFVHDRYQARQRCRRS
jgi:hypothetical protein